MAFHIGNVAFSSNLFMAPMEGISDVPFRKIVRKHGCGVTCTQMVHAEALKYGTERRLRETTTMVESEKPVGFQLCSPDPDLIAEAARKVEQMGAAFIDINMGCPAKNVVQRGAGAALLKEPLRAAAILRAIVQAVKIPVTAKIRAGWDDTYRNAPEVASVLESEGAQLITVHARTRAQQHKGTVDWNLITELKARLRIPVIGNGGVNEVGDAERMMRTTGADGVMIARGALGNPWIFENRKPTLEELAATIEEHLQEHLAFYESPERALITFRKHVVWYTKGLIRSADLRVRLFQERTLESFASALREFLLDTRRAQ